jgi:hypothetical protein
MGSYTTVKNGKRLRVQVTDDDALRDVADLWAVVKGEYNGTPSTESDALKNMLGDLQHGKPLSDPQFALKARLLDKYAAALKEFRASPESDTEGYIPLPPTGSGRLMEAVALLPPSLRAHLRESKAPPPPNLRPSGISPMTAASATQPPRQCGACKMFEFGHCWGYGDFPVDHDWVCNAWVADPDWKAQEGTVESM